MGVNPVIATESVICIDSPNNRIGGRVHDEFYRLFGIEQYRVLVSSLRMSETVLSADLTI